MHMSKDPYLRFVLSALAALVLAVLVTYRAAPDGWYVLDDVSNIQGYAGVQIERLDLDTLRGAIEAPPLANRDLAYLSFAVDWWRGGGDPAPFKWTNMVLHALSTMAVFGLILVALTAPGGRRPSRADGIAALIAAGLWALHPIQTMAVAYIVQRMALLAGLGSVGAVLFYLLARRAKAWPARIGFGAAALLAALLAMTSKENAWILPLLVLLAEIGLVRPTPAPKRWFGPTLGVIGAAVALIALDLIFAISPFGAWIQRGYDIWAFSLGQRVLTEPSVLWFYLSQIALPLPGRFSLEHGFAVATSLIDPWWTLPALLGWVAWVVVGLRALFSEHWRLFGFVMIWWALAHGVESTVIPLDLVFEHRNYLPSVGLAVLAAFGLRRLAKRYPMPTVIGGGVAMAALAAFTGAYVATFETSLAAYRNAQAHGPDLPRLNYNLASALKSAKQYDEALSYYARAGRWTLPFNGPLPDDRYKANVENGTAETLAALGRIDEAQGHWQAAVALNPDHALARHGLAYLAIRKGQAEEAARHLTALVGLRPDNPTYHIDLGVTLAGLGEFAQARQQLQEALRLAPNNVIAKDNLSRLP